LGRIFKTPTDDSTEATLRAMHTQNTLDNYYERSVGWFRTVICTILGILIVSYYEDVSGNSVWEYTVEWFWNKVQDFGNWVLGWVNG
tara:strand:+ start:157 stop:417 length:261 start_codon:yes stop_codon:yes gene_type:complete